MKKKNTQISIPNVIVTYTFFNWAALQHAGRNPSQKTINKYWTPQTAKLNFDDFCIILSKEKPTSKAELLKSFKKLDVNDDGAILHSDLQKYLTKVRPGRLMLCIFVKQLESSFGYSNPH